MLKSSAVPLRITRTRDWGMPHICGDGLAKDESRLTTLLRLVVWAGSAPGQQWSKRLQSRCLLPQGGLLREGDTSGLGHLCRNVPGDGALVAHGVAHGALVG